MQECKGHYAFSRHMSNLANLCHFLVPQDKLQLHSIIADVGKLKLLQELRSFEVGRETKGFELSQLSQLSELGVSLSICRLERIRAVEDAHEARLIQIKHLYKLTLEWDANRPKKDTTHEENVLEILVPCSNLKELCIAGHGGTKCPQWLGKDLSVKNLESLHLDGVDWNIFPPIGELWLVNGPHEEISSNIHHNRFQNLRTLELVNLPRLKNWVVNASCHLFALLEVLIIRDCSELTNISFSHSTCCQLDWEEEANMNTFPPRLQELEIASCPKLLSIPPVPWTRALCSTKIKGLGLGFENLVCEENKYFEYKLEIMAAVALDDGTFWNVLAFDNLTELEVLEMNNCPPLQLHHFQMLASLKTLNLYNGSSIVVPLVDGESHASYQFPVECITIRGWDASAKELTQLLTYFPKLSELNVWCCEKITGLAIVEKHATETPTPASPDNIVDDIAEIDQRHHQQDGTIGQVEIGTSSAEGLLFLPSHLQTLQIRYCPELSLCSTPIDRNKESGRTGTGGGQGLQGLGSLRSLEIYDFPRFLSSYSSSSSSCSPFPTSLECLSLRGAVGTATLLSLSNLTSLTDLFIDEFKNLRGEGLWPLLVQGSLTKLTVYRTPNFFAGLETLLLREQEFPYSSSKLLELLTDDVAGALSVPICAFLSSSLTKLIFGLNNEMKRFTKEQEDALQRLTSLEEIGFSSCGKLQCLPAGRHGLPSLKRLRIYKCPAIRSLPKDCLPSSLQKLEINDCPAIRSLPKVNDLPSSLQELNVRNSKNKELRRQCRKLIGIVPVVYA